MKYDLICIDMFQTLVNVHSRADVIWKRILDVQHTSELATKCKIHFHQLAIQGFFSTNSREATFRSLESIFREYFQQLTDELHLNIDPHRATKIFLEEHNFAEPYADTARFFEKFSGKVRISLVSDADAIMLVDLLKGFTFDKVFMSEETKAYKNDPQGRMFENIISHYNIDPHRILHIGDANGDIAGANKAGIHSCWINRTETAWQYAETPMYEITSLDELEAII